MGNPRRPLPGGELSYFDVQAAWGVTKHLGGTAATDELVALSGIGAGSLVLEVGCGAGQTPVHIARTTGCRVVGVDLSERMIAWSQRRALRSGEVDRIRLSVADAAQLPFADGVFDAVICESVTAFVPDKPRTVSEYVRVVRPGGHVGLSEGTWIRQPPPDLAAYLRRVMAGAEFQTPDAWRQLLEGAGLTQIVARSFPTSTRSQWRGEMERMDSDDARDRARAWKSFAKLLVTSADFRRYVRELIPSSRSIFHLFDYFGYGVFVGRKPDGGAL